MLTPDTNETEPTRHWLAKRSRLAKKRNDCFTPRVLFLNYSRLRCFVGLPLPEKRHTARTARNQPYMISSGKSTGDNRAAEREISRHTGRRHRHQAMPCHAMPCHGAYIPARVGVALPDVLSVMDVLSGKAPLLCADSHACAALACHISGTTAIMCRVTRQRQRRAGGLVGGKAWTGRRIAPSP